MRPVNLLPPEERRGGHAPMRTGALPYVLIGALVLLLAGVTALVLTDNQVSEREDEVAQLRREDARESARADRLAAYTQFQSLQEQRVETVTSLADSRFDWERVMHELSLILPHDVWLVGLAASASPESGIESGGGSLRASSPGPALELEGCAAGQDSVAGLVSALKDIDGVTRVGVKLSELPSGESSTSSSSGSESDGNTDCRTRKWIAKFEIVAVFDAAPIVSGEEGEAGLPSATEVASTTSETSSEEGSSEEAEGSGE
jgi:Tfp pilus assembly protein PilN